MKNTLLLFIFTLFSGTLLSQNTYSAPKVTTLPIFDGVGNDRIWADATWQNMDQVWIPYNNILPSNYTTESGTKVLNGASDFSGKYKIVWSQDTSYLLFLVEIQDDVFIDNYVKPTANYPNYDILEIFIDENKSGGNHLFDANGFNAENAFAYHIAVNNPGMNQSTTSMVGAMDFNGNSYSNIVDYQSHFPSFSFKNHGNGKFVYEFALKIYKDTYTQVNPAAALKNLSLNDIMGLSIAYCDNDDPDGKRDHFISSVSVPGDKNNDSYIDATIFGTLTLAGASTLDVNENDLEKGNFKVYPNPFSKNFQVNISNENTSKDMKIKIFDFLGKEVISTPLQSHDTTVSMSGFKSGIYFYKIMSDSKVLKEGKLLSK